MVGLSRIALNECCVPAVTEVTPQALNIALVEDDPRVKQLISAQITYEE